VPSKTATPSAQHSQSASCDAAPPLRRVSCLQHLAHVHCGIGAVGGDGRLTPVLTQRSTAKIAYIHAPTSSGTAKSASGLLPSTAPPITQASTARTLTRQRAVNVKFHEFIGFSPVWFRPQTDLTSVRGILGSTMAKIHMIDGGRPSHSKVITTAPAPAPRIACAADAPVRLGVNLRSRCEYRQQRCVVVRLAATVRSPSVAVVRPVAVVVEHCARPPSPQQGRWRDARRVG
jgi:hypothetical protein